jgi:superoxide dismutase
MNTIRYIASTVILFFLAGSVSSVSAQNYPYELPKLPYGYTALEPVVDATTMEIHYSKHHASYVKNLNAAVKGTKYESYSLDELMLYAGELDATIKNNAGGHYNHSLFWNILSVNNPFNPESEVGKEVIRTFGSPDSLNKLLYKAGSTRFGSGWAWLYVNTDRKLVVCSTPNQDNPIMDVSADRGIPILCIDVWEHAYYLKYQNKRTDYLTAILTAINWDAVNKNYTEALVSPLLKSIEQDTWAELNAFHEVMAETFHPSEDGDLKPIRARSGEFLEKAEALKNGKIPTSFNTPEIKKSIDDLVKGAAALKKMVLQKASDKVLAKKLGELHDVFHTIQGLCRH